MVPFWFGYLILSWLCADLIAGTFHWWEDRYDITKVPFVGKLLDGVNAGHHESPTMFLAGNYWQRNWSNILPVAFVAMAVTYFAPWYALPFWFATQANEVHGWSHQKCNRLIRMLQETELFVSVKHHAQHHVDPFSRRYCVMTGWLNPCLDAFGYWRTLELIGYVVFRVKPKHQYGVVQK